MNVGSLRNESIVRLEQGLEDDATSEKPQTAKAIPNPPSGDISREITGNPWFEETLESHDLGRIRRRRGGHTSADGKSKIEWEVVEVGGDEGEGTSPHAKRVNVQRDQEGNDIQMSGSG